MDQFYWVVDVEGNGANPPEIIELAIVEIADWNMTGRDWHWRVRPKSPIERSASRIHGITDEDLANAPSIEDIADDVLTWLDNATIVGHNVRVEVETISRSFPEWRPKAAIDTIRLAKLLKPGLTSYSLAKLGDALGHADKATQIAGSGHHSANYDATLTALIFVQLVSTVHEPERSQILQACDILRGQQRVLL